MFEIVDLVRRNQVLTDLLDQAAAGLLGINRTDASALDVIDQHGRIAAGDLAKELRLTTGAVTAVVDRLERAGYARRVPDPEDRRRVLVEVTPLMHEKSALIYTTPEDNLADWADWTDEEVDVVVRFQQKSREWLEARLAAVEKLAAEAKGD